MEQPKYVAPPFVLDFYEQVERMRDIYADMDEDGDEDGDNWDRIEAAENELRNKLKGIAADESVADVDYFECLYRFETVCDMETMFPDVEAVVRGFKGDFSERVPDSFFADFLKHWTPESASVEHCLRTAPNTSPDLRRLYAFWKAKEIGQKYPRYFSIFCVIEQAVFKRIEKVCYQNKMYHTQMFWKTNYRPRSADYPPFRGELLNAILDPKRIERVGLDVIKKMILPVGDDEIFYSYLSEPPDGK